MTKINEGYIQKINGAYFFSYDSEKTNGESGTEIASVGGRILDKYLGTEEGIPVIHDVTLNKDLKQFGAYLKRYFIKHKTELEKEGLILQDWEKSFKKRRRKRGAVVTIDDVNREDFTTHLMRRTGITSLAIAGLTKDEIKKVSGHKTDSELDKYIKIADRFRNRNVRKAWASIMD